MKVMEFKDNLMKKERSAATIEKYVRDVRGFLEFIAGEVTHEGVLRYKEYLCGRYAMRSVTRHMFYGNFYAAKSIPSTPDFFIHDFLILIIF